MDKLYIAAEQKGVLLVRIDSIGTNRAENPTKMTDKSEGIRSLAQWCREAPASSARVR
jgi:hypothetical protein